MVSRKRKTELDVVGGDKKRGKASKKNVLISGGNTFSILSLNVRGMSNHEKRSVAMDIAGKHDISMFQDTQHDGTLRPFLTLTLSGEFMGRGIFPITHSSGMKSGGLYTITSSEVDSRFLRIESDELGVDCYHASVYRLKSSRLLVMVNIYIPPYNSVLYNYYKDKVKRDLATYIYGKISEIVGLYNNGLNYVLLGGDFNTYLVLKNTSHADYVKRHNLLVKLINTFNLVDIATQFDLNGSHTYYCGQVKSTIDYILGTKNLITERIILGMKISESKMVTDHLMLEITLDRDKLFDGKITKYNIRQSLESNLKQYQIALDGMEEIKSFNKTLNAWWKKLDITNRIKEAEKNSVSNLIIFEIIEAFQTSSRKALGYKKKKILRSKGKIYWSKLLTDLLDIKGKIQKTLNDPFDVNVSRVLQCQVIRLIPRLETIEPSRETDIAMCGDIRREMNAIKNKSLKSIPRRVMNKIKKNFVSNKNIKKVIKTFIIDEEEVEQDINMLEIGSKIISNPTEILKALVALLQDWFAIPTGTHYSDNKSRINDLKLENFCLLDDMVYNYNSNNHFNIDPKFELIMDGLRLKNPTEMKGILNPISLDEFNNYIKLRQKNKVGGLTGITYNHLKVMNNDVKLDMLRLLNIFLKERKIPEILNASIIMPIKKSSGNSINNIRPLTMTDVWTKTLFGIIFKRIEIVLENKELLNPAQNGFRKNRGTHNVLLGVKLLIDYSKFKKQDLYLYGTDFKRAYDSIPWFMIYLSLRRMNVPAGVMALLLQNRSEAVNIVYKRDLFNMKEVYTKLKGNILNKDRKVTRSKASEGFIPERGIPQGRNESPLIWNTLLDILLDIIDNNIENKVEIRGQETTEYITSLAYADDVTWCFSTQEDMERGIEIIDLFCEFTGLKVNYDKSSISRIRYKNKRPMMVVPNLSNAQVLKEDESQTHLGFTVNGKKVSIPMIHAKAHFKILGLKMSLTEREKEHVKEKTAEINKILSSLKYRKVPGYIFKYIYEAVIIPKLAYALQYTTVSNYELEKLDILLRDTIKLKMRLTKSFPTEVLYMPQEVYGFEFTSLIDLVHTKKLVTLITYSNDKSRLGTLMNANLVCYQIQSRYAECVLNIPFHLKSRDLTYIESLHDTMITHKVKIVGNKSLRVNSIYKDDVPILEVTSEFSDVLHSHQKWCVSDIIENGELKDSVKGLYQTMDKKTFIHYRDCFCIEQSSIIRFTPIVQLVSNIDMRGLQYKHVIISRYFGTNNKFVNKLVIGEVIRSSENEIVILPYRVVKSIETVKRLLGIKKAVKYSRSIIHKNIKLPRLLVKVRTTPIVMSYCWVRKVILTELREDIFKISDYFKPKQEMEIIPPEGNFIDEYFVPKFTTHDSYIGMQLWKGWELTVNPIRDILYKCGNELTIVSDASLKLQGEGSDVGVAYCIVRECDVIGKTATIYGNMKRFGGDNNKNSSFRGELLGILFAIRELDQCRYNGNVIHYLDNQAVVNLFNRIDSKSIEELIEYSCFDLWKEIKFLRTGYTGKYVCEWIPGHEIETEIPDCKKLYRSNRTEYDTKFDEDHVNDPRRYIKEHQYYMDILAKFARDKCVAENALLESDVLTFTIDGIPVTGEFSSKIKRLLKLQLYHKYIGTKNTKHPDTWLMTKYSDLDTTTTKKLVKKYRNTNFFNFLIKLKWDWLPTNSMRSKHGCDQINKCMNCSMDAVEDINHVLFKCDHQEMVRLRNKVFRDLLNAVGEIPNCWKRELLKCAFSTVLTQKEKYTRETAFEVYTGTWSKVLSDHMKYKVPGQTINLTHKVMDIMVNHQKAMWDKRNEIRAKGL